MRMPTLEASTLQRFYNSNTTRPPPPPLLSFPCRALPVKPVLTSADLVELAGATRRNAERTGSRGGTGMSSRGSSRGGSRMGSRGSSRGSSRGGTGRPGTSGSSSGKKSRTVKTPANAALAGLNISGNEKPTSARPSSADPRKPADAGLTPLEQLRRARKLIADMKKYNTTDHTWELLATPGITKEEQKLLWQTDKQIVMNEAHEPWWTAELKYQPSVMFPEFNSKVTENTKWAESALIANQPLYQSGSMRGGGPK